MPRFCSSKTRPNSLLIGGGISVATMLKPKARLWPARSERASISRASGSCAAKAFSRRLRRHKQPEERQAAITDADQRQQQRVDARSTSPSDAPPAPGPREIGGQLAAWSGSCRPARTAGRCCRTARGTFRRGPACRPAAGRGCWLCLARPSLAGGGRDAGQAGRGGLRSCWPACRATAGPRRRPGRRLRRTPRRRSAAEAHAFNPPA